MSDSAVRITTSKRRYRFVSQLLLPFTAKGPAVYAILNKTNGKIYVGSSVRVNHRMTEHRCSLADSKHGNRYLQRAFEPPNQEGGNGPKNLENDTVKSIRVKRWLHGLLNDVR